MPSELTAFGEIASHLANPLPLIGLALLLFFGVHRALVRSRILPPVDRKASGVIIIQSLLRYGFWIAALLIVLSIGYAGYKDYLKMQWAIVCAEVESDTPKELTKVRQSYAKMRIDLIKEQIRQPQSAKQLTRQIQRLDLREQEDLDRLKVRTGTCQALAKKG